MSGLSLTQLASPGTKRLSGRTLTVARLGGWAFFIIAGSIFVAALPARWAQLTQPSPTTLANLSALHLAPTLYAAYLLALEIVFTGTYLITGLILFLRRADDRMALLAALVLVAFGAGNQTVTPTSESLRGLSPWLDFLLNALITLAWIGFAWFFYLFPNGQFVPGWTRWLAVAWAVIAIPWNFAASTALAPLHWPPWLFASFIGAFWASWLFSQLYRYRQVSNAIERQQTKWIVFATALVVSVGVLFFVVGSFLPGYALLVEDQPTPVGLGYLLIVGSVARLGMLLIPLTLAFSILRYRLWEIDSLINRTLVYGALTIFVVGAYVLVVGGLGVAFQASGNFLLSLIATGVIALLFNPLREWLQYFVNRLVYGERDDPYTALSRFSQQLEGALAPDLVLPTLAETVARTLKLPQVVITLKQDDQFIKVAAYPPAVRNSSVVAQTISLPLTYQGETLGQLQATPHAPDEPFTPTERRLLEDIAAQAGLAVNNVRLAAALQHSREQLVAAREEERRRLRRDLHDGLGPKLAGQTLKLEAALEALDTETETARALLNETLHESQGILTEIRRLVYGLRPPALDELGLLSAIQEQAAQYQLRGLRVTLIAPQSLPPLPAAVEVAVYRLVQEALTNVVRHAQAQTCQITLTINATLKLVIQDDGRGLPAHYRPGVGFTSLRERAEEIGGRCTIQSDTQTGTRVEVHLPLNSSTHE